MEIEAKDLRIGNYLNGSFGGWVKVRGITQKGIWIQNQSGPAIENMFSGITITSEILEKAGFEKTVTKMKLCDDYIDYRIKQFVCFLLPHNRLEVEFHPQHENIEERGYLCTITYLHQLQNLYLALTGQELNIEL